MKVDILGTQIDSLTQAQALDKIDLFLNHQPLAIRPQRQAGSHQIITANPEIILEAWANKKYRELINKANLVLADGIGVLWAAKFLSLKSDSIFTTVAQLIVSLFSLVFQPDYCREVLPQRIAGVDIMEKICEQASKQNKKVYLLGAEEGVAKKTADILKKKYLNLNIVGSEPGPILQTTTYPLQPTNNIQETINKIKDVQPDILFVAFGAPKQDFFINQYLNQIPSVKVAIGVGGAFDFISGKAKRAPQVYRDLGLEWLHRFFHEPKRAVRIFNATIKFIYKIVILKNYGQKN